MRPLHVIAFALTGALLAYLVTRQVAPKKLDELGAVVSNAYENIIARFEGFRADAYQDEAGLWTIGFGHLIKPGDGFYSPSNPNGARTIDITRARELYDADTATARDAVARSVRVPLTDAQESALISLAYNIGPGAFATSTLVRLLNAGDYEGAAEQFLVWNKVHDEYGNLVASNGLTARRQKEMEIFLA